MKLTDALAIKVGTADALAVYAGTVKVWPVATGGGGTPAFVQKAIQGSTTATNVIPLTTPAVAGNLLVIAVAHASAQTPTSTGFTAGVRQQGNFRYVTTMTKVAAGGETSITVNMGASGTASACVTEWSGAQAGATTQGTLIATTTPKTFGPSGAPPSASSVPLLLYSLEAASSATLAFSSPWAGDKFTTNPAAGYASQAAPNAAASGTVTCSVASGFGWVILWLNPA
jgi:hypothetical protein